jgi:glutathione S-transferase
MDQHLPYLATIFASLIVFILGYRTGAARRKHGIVAPAMTGNIEFERVYRTQMNTIESLAYFLPLMWTFSFYISPLFAGLLGFVWCAARVAYAAQYSQGKNRSIPFFVSLGVSTIYLVGSLFGIIRVLFQS